jgi:hypothetical protein
MVSFTVTYEIVGIDEETEEVVVMEHGWYNQGHWDYTVAQHDYEKNPHLYHYYIGRGEGKISLRDAVKMLKDMGISRTDSFTALGTIDPERDYSYGTETYYHVHFHGVTPSSLKRIVRLFN